MVKSLAARCRSRFLLAAAATALLPPAVLGADLPSDYRVTSETVVRGRIRTPVTVDALHLRDRRCRVDPDCIAPRVLPIDHWRAVTYSTVLIPVDPRFANRYGY